jgi:cysteinyl-tRNA synthetase
VIPEITLEEKQEIDKMIADREIFRKEKQFEKADQIRDKLIEMNVVLVDHKKRTVWMKKEKIKSDN